MKSLMRIAAILLIGLLQGCSDTPSLDFVPEDGVILAFGDSLTVGVGASQKDSYPSVLARLSQRRVINAGVSGEVTREGLKRLPVILEESQPQLVILLQGGNDILKGKDIGLTKANLSAMISMIQNQGADVILIGVPEKKLFSDVASIYKELAVEHNVVLLDDTLSGLLKNNKYKSDPIHLNVVGYQKLAEVVYNKLLDVGAL
jgi:lysophospholipase L1-like esterase